MLLLQFDKSISKFMLILIIMMTSITSYSIILCAFSKQLTVLSLLLLLLLMIWQCQLHVWRSHPKAIIAVSYQANNNTWQLHLRNQQLLQLRLTDVTLIGPLLLLAFIPGRYWLCCSCDMLINHNWRALLYAARQSIANHDEASLS